MATTSIWWQNWNWTEEDLESLVDSLTEVLHNIYENKLKNFCLQKFLCDTKSREYEFRVDGEFDYRPDSDYRPLENSVGDVLELNYTCTCYATLRIQRYAKHTNS